MNTNDVVDDVIHVSIALFLGAVIFITLIKFGYINPTLSVTKFTPPPHAEFTPPPFSRAEAGINSDGIVFYPAILNNPPVSCIDLFFQHHNISTHKVVKMDNLKDGCQIGYYFKTRQIVNLPLHEDQEPIWKIVWVLNYETIHINEQDLTSRSG